MPNPERASLLIDPKKPIDNAIWVQLNDVKKNKPATYDLLTPSKEVVESARQDFFDNDCKINPDLRPISVSASELTQHEAELHNFREWLRSLKDEGRIDSEIIQAYRWRINEMIANNRMVQAAVSGDMSRFRCYNEFVYGEPNPEIYAATVDWFRDWALELLASDNPEILSAAKDVLEVLPDTDGDKTLLIPPKEVFERIREQHFREMGYFALLLSGIELPDEGKITREIGDPILEQVVSNLESDYGIGDAKGSTWSVDYSNGLIKRPAAYNLAQRRFLGLAIGHEIGGHLLERQNGMRQSVRLFATGLDRTENGSEGRSVIREQIVYPDFDMFSRMTRWQDILRRHFAISLATGMGGQTMNFHEVYRVIEPISKLWERSKNPDNIDDADVKASQKAFALLASRIFRGSDGSEPYRKDQVYLEGNVACWKLPHLIEEGDKGKFDISNPRHIAFAIKTGVLSADTSM